MIRQIKIQAFGLGFALAATFASAGAAASTCSDFFISNSAATHDDAFLRDGEVVVLIDHVSASHKVLSRAKVRREFNDGASAKMEVTADLGSTKIFDRTFVYSWMPQRRVSAVINDLSATEKAAATQPNILLVASRRLPSLAADAEAPVQYIGLLANGRLVNVSQIVEELN